MTRLLFFILAFAAHAALALERHSIPSLDGKLQIPGYRFGAIAAEPRPAVISLHGCGGLLDDKGGLSRNRHRVAEYFNVERMHFLAIDSFTPRGLNGWCGPATRLCASTPRSSSAAPRPRKRSPFPSKLASQWRPISRASRSSRA